MSTPRKDGRRFNELRAIEILPGTAPYAEGSAAVRFGNTQLLVTASIEKEIPKWSPHRLRHNAATKLRREFGIEAARVVLGHRSAAVTEIYAEVDRSKAAAIMGKVG